MKPSVQSSYYPKATFNEAAEAWAQKPPIKKVIISDPGDEQPGEHIVRLIVK